MTKVMARNRENTCNRGMSMVLLSKYKLREYVPKGCAIEMKKLSRGAYEDTKGFLRVAETLLEVLVLTVLYYIVWKQGYDFYAYEHKGKYVLMGIYAALTYAFFQYSDCTMFGRLNRMDLIIGQIISLLIVNVVTYAQLFLIGNAVTSCTRPTICCCCTVTSGAWN